MHYAILFLKQHKTFAVLFTTLLLLKSIVGMMSVKDEFTNKLIPVSFSFDKNFAGFINNDEIEMITTALYKINRNEYMMVLRDHPFRKDSLIVSAFRPRLNVYLHVICLKQYMKATGVQIENISQLPRSYLNNYGLAICILKTILFAVSAFFFLKLLLLLFSKQLAMIGTVLYLTLPPIFFYIGILDIFENIAMPILVIVISWLYEQVDQEREPGWFAIICISTLVAISCLIRPQTLFIYLIFLSLYILLWIAYFIKNRSSFYQSKLVFISASFVFIIHTPILISNYKKFGSFFLSTQAGAEFIQGHNPFARGSWYYGLLSVRANDFKPYFDNEPGLNTFNEKHEMDFYFQLGKNWMLSHPKEELILTARKTALYFLPYNYLNHIFNPLNLLVYLGTIGFVLFSLPQRVKKAGFADLLKLLIILTPFIGSYLLTIIFFMGERWRYYAEPFMVIYTLIFFNDLYKYFKKKKTINHQLINE